MMTNDEIWETSVYLSEGADALRGAARLLHEFGHDLESPTTALALTAENLLDKLLHGGEVPVPSHFPFQLEEE